MTYKERAERVLARIDELAAISEHDAGIVTRTFGTPAFLRGRDLVQGWFEAAGLHVRTDSIGNLHGCLESPDPNAKTFVIGSHIDTVVNAGKYDGPLGVLLGLDVLEHFTVSHLPFNLDLVAFSDEEGVRFHTTYLGSQVLAGSFDMELLKKADANGITLAEALAEMGITDAHRIPEQAKPADQWLGYLEVHIEQGPVLWEKPLPVAVVTAIAGQQRLELAWRGMAGHAGTVPMTMRQDALAAAAEFVLAVEAVALAGPAGLVATVGKLHLPLAASNVIPGEVTHSLDVRSPDSANLAAAVAELHTRAEAIAARRGVTMAWKSVQQSAPVQCDTGLNAHLEAAIAEAGYEVVRLVSGAGHDAVPIAAVAPATMLFIRCYRGISHNPLENVELADVAAAIAVAERFLHRLASSLAPVPAPSAR
ncbi:MAG: allantoate amidohydrolase [Hymenobacteraceae bacterium]|nr:allantoate amidohydrolase [Hymenobacteraceae bacterium]